MDFNDLVREDRACRDNGEGRVHRDREGLVPRDGEGRVPRDGEGRACCDPEGTMGRDAIGRGALYSRCSAFTTSREFSEKISKK